MNNFLKEKSFSPTFYCCVYFRLIEFNPVLFVSCILVELEYIKYYIFIVYHCSYMCEKNINDSRLKYTIFHFLLYRVTFQWISAELLYLYNLATLSIYHLSNMNSITQHWFRLIFIFLCIWPKKAEDYTTFLLVFYEERTSVWVRGSVYIAKKIIYS